MVVSIDPDREEKLRLSRETYDTRVAGIVSGAGGVSPGIQLSQDDVLRGTYPIALAGKVYVNCTAENGAIRPGDRLTTSSLAGHAMRATDRERSQAALIGKALGSLDGGTGLVLVLVNLQ